MEKKNQTRIEDLPVETKQAVEVKGGIGSATGGAGAGKHPDAPLKVVAKQFEPN